jgi:signal recognition particle subunit SEC65
MNEYDDILNRIVEEFYDTGKLILEARGKRLTNDELRNIALNYKTRGEWAEKDKNSYQQAIKRGKEIPGFYEDITSHMIVLKKHLTNDQLRNIAKKYSTKIEWRKNDPTTYDQALYRNKNFPGFWEDITSGMETRQQKKYLTNDELRNIAKKYRTKIEWNRNDRTTYAQAYNRDKKFPGFWEDITSHMETFDASKKHIYAYEFYDKENNPIAVYVGLTCDMTRRNKEHQTGYCRFGKEETQVFKFIKENPKLKYEIKLLEPNQYKGIEAQQKEIEWEEKYRHSGWRTLNIAKPGSLGGIYKLTNDELRNIAKKYRTKSEWKKNDPNTYNMGLKRDKDFYEDITSHMKSISLTNDELRDIAKKYRTKSEWKKNDPNSYAQAYNRDKNYPGFWEDITSHMIVLRKHLTNDQLRNIAKKYSTKIEWRKNDRKAYQQAVKRGKEIPGFYEDITSHMGSDDILDRVVEEFFDTGKFVF